jgi:beta-glucanase (GH16 family)
MTGTSYPGGAPNWGNNEVESYSGDKKNLVVTAAKTLLIKVVKLPGFIWTSGRIESKRADFIARSGGKLYIEANIRMGNAPQRNHQGLWPAFWALGGEFRGNYQNWPWVSEWDIMESINGQNIMHSVLHCGTAPGGVCNEFNGIGQATSWKRTNWNRVGFLVDRSMIGQSGKTWRDEEISWYLNGAKIHSVKGSRINDEATWDQIAHKGHFLIFNVAVGGNWPGPPNESTRSHEATAMEVDYVGVWNK